MHDQRTHKLINGYFILIWIYAFFLQIGQNIFNNSVSLYMDSIGLGTDFAGLLAIPYAILAIVARLIGGWLTDHRGRRVTMLLGAAIFAVSAFLFTRPVLALPVCLLLLRGLHGFAYGTGNTAASTAVVDVTPPQQSGLGLGIYWAAQGVALAIGGLLVTGLMRGTDDFSLVFFTSVAVLVIAMALALLCNYEKKPDWAATDRDAPAGDTQRGIARFIEKRSIPYAVFFTVFFVGNACMAPYILMFAAERGIAGAGLVFTMAAVGMTLANLTCGKLAQLTHRPALVIAVVYVCFGLAVIAMALISGTVTYVIAGFFYGASMGMAPLVQDEAVRGLPVLRRGAGTSTLYLAIDIGVGIGTAVWGKVVAASGFTAMYIAAGVVSLVAAVMAVVTFARRDKAAAGGK